MKSRAASINDLDLKNWKEYDDILTDSLWMLGARDKSGAHNNAYHGNFIPQIPNQFMQRFTRRGDVVLDPFLGSGTTLIEAKRLGRHGIGIELLPEVAQVASDNIARELLGAQQLAPEVIVADNASEQARKAVLKRLKQLGKDKLHMILLHPPYHDIIRFSARAEDLSNAPTVEEFTARFGDVVANFSDLLEKNRYLAIVIGDKYANSEWVPLGFYLMQETMKRDATLKLKSILIKNMVNNRAKLNQENLWRYRALVGGFYVFKHEYVLVFKKT